MTDESKTSEPHTITMTKLRERLISLSAHGAIAGAANRDFLNATLNQILKEVENDRIKHESAAERLEKQAVAERARAEGCKAMRALVYNVVDRFALAAEADARQREELAKIEADAQAEDDEDEYEEVEVEEEVEEEEEDEGHPEEGQSSGSGTPSKRRGGRRKKKM